MMSSVFNSADTIDSADTIETLVRAMKYLNIAIAENMLSKYRKKIFGGYEFVE